MLALSKRKLVIGLLALAFAAVIASGYLLRSRHVPATSKVPRELRFDEELFDGSSNKSEDLASDIKLMWRTVPHKDFHVSPVSAINAAERVFESVELVGKTSAEVFAVIGHNKTSNNSGYNFPFWPVKKGTLVYRFDCGNFGWQFNLRLDESGRVAKVERQWIH